MSMRYQAGILTASYFPLKTPDAPTIGAATQASSTSVSVAFTAPTDIGGGAISSYTVVSSPGNIIATGTSSPITVTGLTTGTAYSFRVFANNAFGNSPASASSNVVTPAIQGQQAYTAAGTYSWVAPAGVTSVSVVAVGGGGGGSLYTGGSGGGLGYRNNYAVTPGNSYTAVVGAAGVYVGTLSGTNGGDSFFVSTSVVRGGGGGGGTGNTNIRTTAGTYTGDGGGNGGTSINLYPAPNGGYGGGGAGGYSGNGGDGDGKAGGDPNGTGGAGLGGGGGAGGINSTTSGGGGGVGILGQGSSGAGGVSGGTSTSTTGNPGGGGAGSGGTNGTTATGYNGTGGAYGGGAGVGANGAVGAVRIIWPGTTRSFPSTNTGDL